MVSVHMATVAADGRRSARAALDEGSATELATATPQGQQALWLGRTSHHGLGKYFLTCSPISFCLVRRSAKVTPAHGPAVSRLSHFSLVGTSLRTTTSEPSSALTCWPSFDASHSIHSFAAFGCGAPLGITMFVIE